MPGRSQIARFLTMPNQKPDAEAALRKLGQRIREGHAMKHPATEKDLEAVRNVVRDQYEQEQKAEREQKPAPDASKGQQRQREDADESR
jgi:hypothetical protein